MSLSVEKADTVEDFQKIVDKSNNLLNPLKPSKEDYPKIYEELKNLNVAVSPNPSLQKISSEIQKVQSAKDRVSEILIDVHKNFLIKKRICELLKEGWTSFSTQNSAEKRKGESFLKMFQFIEAAVEAESLYKSTAHIMKNLDSKHESLSRQVTVTGLAMKLNDMSGGSGISFEKEKQAAKAMYRANNDMSSELKEDDFEKDNQPIGNPKKDGDDLYNWK